MLSTKVKGKVTVEYIGRVKKLCGSKPNGGNRIKGINVWAVGVVRYSANIVYWTINELVNKDRRARKILTMHGCLHTRSNVARLYLPRKERERRLIGIEECVKRENKSLCGYLRKDAANGFEGEGACLLVEEENLQDYQRRRKEEKVRNWKEKALHGEFARNTSDVVGAEP